MGTLYVTGKTGGADFPSYDVYPPSYSPFQAATAGDYDSFVVKFSLKPRPISQSFGLPGDICGHENDCPYSLDPVNLATGNAVWQETDLQVVAPGMPFVWWRTYNSRDTASGPLGRGWSLSYSAHLDLSTTGVITVTLEDGAQSAYAQAGTRYLPPPADLGDLTRKQDNTYELRRPDQSILHFSATGQLLSQKDSVGRTITLNYTNSDLSGITDAVGRSYTITTDTQHRITQLNDPSIQRSVAYTYTGALLTDVRDVRGVVTHYGYDVNNHLTSVTLPDTSIRVQNQYDTLGRLIWQQAWNSTPFTVTYDLTASPVNGNLVTRTRVRDSLNRTQDYDYDQDGRLLRSFDQDGQVTVYSVDGNDQPTQSIDPLNRTTRQTYDSRANLLMERDPLGNGPNYTYDALNRLHTEQDALGHTRTYTYTTAGLLRQEEDPIGYRTTYTYTTLSLQGSITMTLPAAGEDALGRVTLYGYNTLGQLAVITNTLNQTTTFTYDTPGRLLQTRDATGVVECHEYDAADHLTAIVGNCVPGSPVTTSQNVRTEYGYDTVGRRIWTRNPLGEVTRTFYNSSGQTTSVVVGCALTGTPSTTTCDLFNATSPELNRITSYGYDSLGHQVAMTNTLGIGTHTDYDTLNRAWRTIRNYQPALAADASTNVTTTLEFDQVGQVLTQTDALGRRNTFGYDGAGRVVTETVNYDDGNPATGATDLDLLTVTRYDTVGLPITRTVNFVDGLWDAARPDEDRATVTWYDAFNRPVTVIENYVDGDPTTGDTGTDLAMSYEYDKVGNLVSTTDPLGRVTVKNYDGLNRPVEEIRNCTDSTGQPQTIVCVQGHGSLNDRNIHTTYTYTARGEQATSVDPLGRTTHLYYDALGRLSRQVANENGTVAPTNVTTLYDYDALGHTTVLTDATTARWTQVYNSAGWKVNRTDPTARTITYGYDGLGQHIVQTDAFNRANHTLYDALRRPYKIVVNWQDGIHQTSDGPDQDLVSQIIYDATGRHVAQVAADETRTNYQLDRLNRLYTVVENANGTTAPINVTTVYTADRRGLPTVITNTRGYALHRVYNAAGWQTSQTDPLTRTVTYAYDQAGRQTSVSDSRPMTVTYSYDLLDRAFTVSAPNTLSVYLTYDIGSL